MLYLRELLVVLLLLLVVAGSLGDIFHDYREGASMAHLVIELILVVASFVLISILSLGIWRQSRSIRHLKAELQASPVKEREAGQPASSEPLIKARHGLGVVLKGQFEEWGLTQTEKEVAMLLLKGLSFREIAAVRNTLEKTVRQQASSIYRKSGVSGRHEFSAWFIEDLI